MLRVRGLSNLARPLGLCCGIVPFLAVRSLLVYFLDEQEEIGAIQRGALQRGISVMDPLGPEDFIQAANGSLEAMEWRPRIGIRLRERNCSKTPGIQDPNPAPCPASAPIISDK